MDGNRSKQKYYFHIVTLKNNIKTIHLFGIIHNSQASDDEATTFIIENKPDKVCIELCKAITEINR